MKKKVLMIIPVLAGGGAERVVSNLTMQLKEKYQMDILLDYDNVSYAYSGNILQMNPGIKQAPDSFHELCTYIRKFFALKKMKRLRKYDCYISHSAISHLLNVMTGNKQCDVVLTLHVKPTDMKHSRISGILDIFSRRFMKRADRMIAVSEGVRQEYIRYYSIPPKKIVSIWNGTDINKIHDKKEEPLPPKKKQWFIPGKTVVTMGRLCEQKGHYHLLRAFSKAAERIPDVRLLVLGDGPLKESLLKLAAELRIQDNVIFVGFQENPFSVLARADLFVFPSLWEGFGYALEEAICCGIPCISSDFQYGAREILHYNTDKKITDAVYTDFGVLVPVCEAKKKGVLTAAEVVLADSIVTVLTDKAYRQKVVENNKKRLAEFSLEIMGDRWAEVIG